MQIGEFNNNLSDRLRTIIATGEPTTITRHGKSYVTVAPTSLFDELVQAAGKRGQEVLDRHRAASEQQEEAAA